ncbi:MAG: prephenate dehydratase [Zetaproteobacteria bacterium]|nr:MAG: prephenate dehydratase [Zetaproteobacteria bacterium]
MSDVERALQELRAAIDAVDDELLALIYRRARLAAKVGEHKQNHDNVPFYVPSREAAIIRRLLARNAERAATAHETKIPDEAIHGIFREIIGACLALEHPMQIAYLGPEGTFTHTAATRQFGSTARYVSCGHLEKIFDEVESGRASYGVVPVENAFEGAVGETLDLFAQVERQVYVCAEIQLAIHHHLLSWAREPAEIRTIYSHPQALAQCQQWIQDQCPQATLMAVESTAKAAEMLLREDGRCGAAAIASLEVAERRAIPVLAANIEDHHDNTTRFFVIGQHDSPPSGEDKTALVMSIKDVPGALYRLLEPFARRGIGLTRIESRPSKRKLWEYVFFADIQGHRDDAEVCAAIGEVEAMPGSLIKVLGSYPVARPL